jgi:hypothetical protein
MVERSQAKDYAPKKSSAADATREEMLDVIREIESVVAAQWGQEHFNDGARAAAVVLRKKLGLGPTDPLPEKPTEAP